MRKERRRHPRAKSDLTARIQWTSRRFDGVVKNVSDNGLFVCCDHRLLPGECVRIGCISAFYCMLFMLLCSFSLFDAEVIWSIILGQEELGGLYGIGFRFLDVCLTQTESSLT